MACQSNCMLTNQTTSLNSILSYNKYSITGPPEALRTWLGQTLLALPFSFLYRAKILVLVIKGLNRSKDLVRTSPHYINRSQNMVRTSPRVLILSGGPGHMYWHSGSVMISKLMGLNHPYMIIFQSF